jgi:hypothetical protein
MKDRIIRIALQLGFLCLNLQLMAGTEPLNVRLNATSIFAGNGIAISDNKYPNPELTGTAKVRSSVAQVVLGIDQSILSNLYASFSLKVNLQITAYDKLGNTINVPQNVALEVKYSNVFGLQFKDRDVYVVKNCHKITALITSVIYTDAFNVSTYGLPAPSIVFLEADIVTERLYQYNGTGTQYQFLASDIVVTAFPTVSPYELEINWPHKLGAEEYDLEWTYVNNYLDATNLVPASQLEYAFKNNATRITTSQNFYRVSLVFEKGYLLFRLRARGRDYTNPDAVIFGDWSNSCTSSPCEAGFVSNYSDFFQVTIPHDENKNWQYSSSFAEEGKKKEVVSYFDGSLRNRQAVTKVNTLNNIVIAENLYDYQGYSSCSHFSLRP